MGEILTLMQTRKIERPIPVILFGSSYWNEDIDFEALVRHGMIERADLSLFRFADDPPAALALLKAGVAAEQEAPKPALAPSNAPDSRWLPSTATGSVPPRGSPSASPA